MMLKRVPSWRVRLRPAALPLGGGGNRQSYFFAVARADALPLIVTTYSCGAHFASSRSQFGSVDSGTMMICGSGTPCSLHTSGHSEAESVKQACTQRAHAWDHILPERKPNPHTTGTPLETSGDGCVWPHDASCQYPGPVVTADVHSAQPACTSSSPVKPRFATARLARELWLAHATTLLP